MDDALQEQLNRMEGTLLDTRDKVIQVEAYGKSHYQEIEALKTKTEKLKETQDKTQWIGAAFVASISAAFVSIIHYLTENLTR